MGIEKDLELMDDYLANRLDDAGRNAFEQKLEADPALKSEFITQKGFVEGIRNARIAELKNIMNNTPIPPAAGGSAVTLKVAAWIIGVSIIGFGVYWFTSQETETQHEEVTLEIPEIASKTDHEKIEETSVNEPDNTSSEAEQVTQKEEAKKENKPKVVAKSKIKQPELEVYDPTKEVAETSIETENDPIVSTKKQKVSSLVVETDNSQKKYSFHYQFLDGKLILMGAFDATLYEILEFFADDKRTIFLFYTGKYFLLDESKVKPTPLTEIKDAKLLEKLETYRAN